MASPLAVANAFLDVARSKGKQLTPLQLIKLVYIAHGWSWVFFKRPLLNEQPQAWQYGPVVPSLYHAVKQFRDQPIAGRLTNVFGQVDVLAPEDMELVDRVFDAYGNLSGGQLSSLTHQPGTPWSDVWSANGRNAPIPDNLISNHFEALWKKQQDERAAHGQRA